MISTRYGSYFDPFDATVDDIDVRDIAYALSGMGRFGCHAGGRYSVAQHSLIVAAISGDVWGLWHDAAEAYLGDQVGPLKAGLMWRRPAHDPIFQSFTVVERNLLRVIAARFELPWDDNNVDRDPWQWTVTAADRSALSTEIRDLFPYGFGGGWPAPPDAPAPLDFQILPWVDPAAGHLLFLDCLENQIVPDLGDVIR